MSDLVRVIAVVAFAYCLDGIHEKKARPGRPLDVSEGLAKSLLKAGKAKLAEGETITDDDDDDDEQEETRDVVVIESLDGLPDVGEATIQALADLDIHDLQDLAEDLAEGNEELMAKILAIHGVTEDTIAAWREILLNSESADSTDE